jgi:DNA adenine methylase
MSMRLPIKWPGNKLAFASTLARHAGLKPIDRDPVRWTSLFGGGMGEVFGLLDAGWLRAGDEVVVVEINGALHNFWGVLESSPGMLHQALMGLPASEGWQGHYETLRAEYNARGTARIRRAALFCWLTRACLNGFWRENRQGQMNQSKASYDVLVMPSLSLLRYRARQLSFLQRHGVPALTHLRNRSSTELRDVVYADPPYLPLSRTACFTGYGPIPYTSSDRAQLQEVLLELAVDADTTVLLSEQSTEAVKDWPKEVFQRCRLPVLRKGSALSKGRGVLKEVLLVSRQNLEGKKLL